MTLKRVRIHQPGTPSVMQYETLASPLLAPGSGQVLLAQEAIGLNYVDTLFRSGAFRVPMPFDMGVDGAGRIEAVGPGVEDLRVGDRVAYFFTPGAYASERLIDADALIKLPDDISSETAASLFTKGLTAWMLIKRVYPVQAGQTILVHGAAGGVGSLLAAWATSVGARVIGTVGSPHKAQAVRKSGLEHVLHTGDPTFLDKVLDITDGVGVDVVYEFIGKATFALSIASLREGGTLAHVGNASGSPDARDKLPIQEKRIRYVQPTTSQYVGERPELEAASAELFSTYRSGVFGHLKPIRYALSDVVRAHEDLAARRIAGAAILIP